MSVELEKYLDRRIRELLAEGKSDSEIVQQLEAVGGRKQVTKLLSAIKAPSIEDVKLTSETQVK